MSKIDNSEVKAATSDSTAGKVIFEPISEDGVFRFDSSANDTDAAYPCLSFINSNEGDVPIMSNKVPLYSPPFEHRLGQQIVKLEIDLRIECRIQFTAPTSFAVITFGPFPSPSAILISLSHAIAIIIYCSRYILLYFSCILYNCLTFVLCLLDSTFSSLSLAFSMAISTLDTWHIYDKT
ncbi:Uncharacterized protein TCM_044243 [Theobroma cacao]|uniref:Uncharacterized protein n=1 Tax=Theobroma cacao TaxID=3641 RepID=A0A061FQS7_THECC|nr:Uncharacterized protein TCM_044243 [Theobroma cacao]